MPTKKRKVAPKAKKVVKKAVKKVPKQAPKKVLKKAMPRVTAIKEPFSKSMLVGKIAEMTDLKKKQVSEVFEAMSAIITGHMKKGAAGEFSLPGLAKFRVVRKPATKARKGVNPFTGEPTVFKAKPARNVVKVRPLKKLKDMV